VPCVYMFGEGCDMPFLNGVCVAVPMASEIRIVQYLLRPHRINPSVPDKIAHIILPFHRDNPVVGHIVSQLRIEDETIGQKIRANTISVGKSREEWDMLHMLLIDKPEEFEQIRLALWQPLDLSLRQQYELEKIINRRKGYKYRGDYEKVHAKSNGYVEPDKRFKTIWDSWHDFLGIDTSKFPQSTDAWKVACRAKKFTTLCHSTLMTNTEDSAISATS
jgi:hypothetical protein